MDQQNQSWASIFQNVLTGKEGPNINTSVDIDQKSIQTIALYLLGVGGGIIVLWFIAALVLHFIKKASA